MRSIFVGLFALFVFINPVNAQLDEVIVLDQRKSSESPGLVLIRSGDFLFLKIKIENDTMDPVLRNREFDETLANIFAAARDAQEVQLSVEIDGVVLSLTEDSSKFRLRNKPCGRGDTRCTSMLLKTPIPKGKIDPETLSNRLESFVSGIEKIGRTSIVRSGSVGISVVDINQYRSEIISIIMEEINSIQTALGEGHKVKLTGIDQKVEYSRSGLLDVALYIPYEYSILPDVRYSDRD